MPSASSTSAWRSAGIALAIILTAFGALLFVAPNAAAVTYVRGTISANTVWGIDGVPPDDDTYILTANVRVASGVTLTVLPGTTVKFDPSVTLYVNGALYADGKAGNEIRFMNNNSLSLTPPRGIQFNATSTGSVSNSTFDRFYTPVTARNSAPSIRSNVIDAAVFGFDLENSASFVWGNTIKRGSLGIYLSGSDAYVGGNTVNGTGIGIQIVTSGSPVIEGNTIRNISSAFTVGILVGSGTSPVIRSNQITNLRGTNGPDAILSGAPGGDGGIAFGIYLDSPISAFVDGNTIGRIRGGDGGRGAANAGGTGGRGGNGGPAVGILIVNSPTVWVGSNSVTNLSGGRGGNGAGFSPNGGNAGDAGDVAGIYVVNAASVAQIYWNWLDGLLGGVGGIGGDGTLLDGTGGAGGDAFGLFASTAMNADVSGNGVLNLRGGYGGNSTASGGGTAAGGKGGDALGILGLPVAGSTVFHSNYVSTITGGDAGRGSRGGAGGNASGAVAFGYNDGTFNATSATANRIEYVTGGLGAFGTRFGGDGGIAAGLSLFLVSASSGGNIVWTVRGGAGGNAGDGTDGGRGGDAVGIMAYVDRTASSLGDSIDTVTKGAAGAGPPVRASYASGYYALGNASLTTRLTVNNGTIANVGNYDFNVDNYTAVTTINTPFGATKVAVQAAGTLTVKNYLEVDAFWPNGVTPVNGAWMLVEDNGSPIWNQAAPTGTQYWILVTDRVYPNSNTPVDNQTRVTVTYLSYNFANSPRSVDMSTSHAEPFVMVDKDVPTSVASPLPPYENSFTFTVAYTASDGNGTGLGNVTLWYRSGGGWTAYATQPAAPSGQFSFTASADGVYEFTTTVDDLAGNRQSGPSVNNTWTIVDTIRPGSHVNPLGPWQTSTSFVVSWAPDSGVTDIVSYTLQYNAGSGWTNWLVDTTATSGTFTSGPWGAYAFRSIAKDAAGNVEIAPAGNDTWAFVDTIRPWSHTLPLPTYETSLNFSVSWGPQFDTFDIVTYRIQVRDNGGAWTDWIASTTATSATYSGQDGHTYEFRSNATDRAGNFEQWPSGNDSWTILDATPPDAVMTALPAYENVVPFVIAWGPASGTLDIVSYRVQSKDGSGAWADVAGYANTTATSATFVGQDGHVYAFRIMARDRAGNWESIPAGNDTWTIVDRTGPYVTDSAPQGANTNTTPWIVITFSEPMDRTSVPQAFSITPSMNGAFQWSADSRVATFVPARELQAGTTYFVVVDSSAHDLAGNGMLQSKTFQFSTAVPPAGLSLGDFWWALLLIGAAVAGALFVILRRRPKEAPKASAAKESDAIIEDVFLLNHRDGILIKHETRRLRPDVDTDILSGMLTAVQQFVKDALRGDDYADLNEMTVGHMHILIGRGKWLVLAARIEGDGAATWTEQIERCIKDMEDHHWDQLEDWDGDMGLARVLTPYVKKLIQGVYA